MRRVPGLAPRELAQHLLERIQPRLEVAPLVEAFPEDRQPDLLGAGGEHAALGLVEFEARRLELESAELQQTPHVALEVVHHVLVLDSQYFAGQHRNPKKQKHHETTVVAADVLESIGE